MARLSMIDIHTLRLGQIKGSQGRLEAAPCGGRSIVFSRSRALCDTVFSPRLTVGPEALICSSNDREWRKFAKHSCTIFWKQDISLPLLRSLTVESNK